MGGNCACVCVLGGKRIECRMGAQGAVGHRNARPTISHGTENGRDTAKRASTRLVINDVVKVYHFSGPRSRGRDCWTFSHPPAIT
jgi:hypothetical protein